MELALQLAGVEIRADRLVRDPLLGWRNRPGWRGPAFSVNSRGCLGPEFSPQKPADTVRVFCLGCSCTAGDLLPSFDDTYPSQLARELERLYPGRSFEVINAGVGGYSSFQGRTWLERELLGYRPDLVVIYFGWNDHWPARLGGQDKWVSGSLSERLRAWLGWSKVLQLLVRGAQTLRGRSQSPDASPALPAVGQTARVSLNDYEANLKAMVAALRNQGADAILVTAPNYLELAAAGQPPGDQAANGLIGVHAAYNAAVRQVAEELDVCLVDAVRDFRTEPDPARLFWRPPGKAIDFIHLSAEGYGRLARAIAASAAVRKLASEASAP